MDGSVAEQGKTDATSSSGPAEASGQAAARALRADVTVVTAGSVPEQQPQPAASPACPASGRMEVLDSSSPPVTPLPAPVQEKAFPPLATRAANFLGSVVAFVGDGCGVVDDAQYHERLAICQTCDCRNGNFCSACGCWLPMKARGRAFACPIGHWW